MILGKRVLGLAAILFAFCGPALAEATLFDELGGHDGLTRIANETIDLCLKDDRIKVTFDDANIPRLKNLLFEQFCSLTGGGCIYRGRTMKKVHEPLHLNDSDFNALVEDLETAMEHQNVPWSAQSRFLSLLASMEPDVVGKK